MRDFDLDTIGQQLQSDQQLLSEARIGQKTVDSGSFLCSVWAEVIGGSTLITDS